MFDWKTDEKEINDINPDYTSQLSATVRSGLFTTKAKRLIDGCLFVRVFTTVSLASFYRLQNIFTCKCFNKNRLNIYMCKYY